MGQGPNVQLPNVETPKTHVVPVSGEGPLPQAASNRDAATIRHMNRVRFAMGVALAVVMLPLLSDPDRPQVLGAGSRFGTQPGTR